MADLREPSQPAAERRLELKVHGWLHWLAGWLPLSTIPSWLMALPALQLTVLRCVICLDPFVDATVSLYGGALDVLTTPYRAACALLLLFFTWPLLVCALGVYLGRQLCVALSGGALAEEAAPRIGHARFQRVYPGGEGLEEEDEFLPPEEMARMEIYRRVTPAAR